MTMFRRSSTRRTTCPACGGAPRGPMAAGEGPVASGSVTPGTVEETVVSPTPRRPPAWPRSPSAPTARGSYLNLKNPVRKTRYFAPCEPLLTRGRRLDEGPPGRGRRYRDRAEDWLTDLLPR